MRKPLRQRKERIILSEQNGTSSEVPQSPVREEILSAQYSGPLPLPSSFREYDRVLSGCAERILKLAEMACLLKSAESTFCAFGAV